jgi:hypothetical protein
VTGIVSDSFAFSFQFFSSLGSLFAEEGDNSDKTRYEVKWTKGGLVKLPERVLSLRFKIQDASLYSFWFGERRGQ